VPKVHRRGLPPKLFQHLLDRVEEREITVEELFQLLNWLERNPEVPTAPWFKRFAKFTVCGDGALIKTFLTPKQTAVGSEVV
jgi:hypothetical protein